MNRIHLQDRYRDVAWAMERFTEAEYAYVAASREDGVPYNIPLCVVRVDGALYFHTALEGLAVDLFRRDWRLCVSCTTYTLRDPEHTTLLFRSAMAFGTVSEVTQPNEKKEIMLRYFGKYLSGDPKRRRMPCALPPAPPSGAFPSGKLWEKKTRPNSTDWIFAYSTEVPSRLAYGIPAILFDNTVKALLPGKSGSHKASLPCRFARALYP